MKINNKPIESLKRFAVYDYVMKTSFSGKGQKMDARVMGVGVAHVDKVDDGYIAWATDRDFRETAGGRQKFQKLNDAKRYAKEQLIRTHLA